MTHPTFCPNPKCRLHTSDPKGVVWYQKFGFHHTKAFGPVQRYRCTLCRKTFSSQTFSIDYYAKRVLSYDRIMREIVGCSSNRHISRTLRASCDSVQNRVARLSRNALSMHEHAMSLIPFAEDVAADGFESFTHSQYHPNNINILVGSRSQFTYFWNEVTIRRKGVMTEKQRLRRDELEKKWKATKGGITRSFAEVYVRIADLCTRLPYRHCTLYTDEHKSYVYARKASASVRHISTIGLFSHIRLSSKLPRTRHNMLFPVNYMDREIRKDQKNHVRETVCHARNQSNMMQRLSLYLWHHNYYKHHRIIDRDQESVPLHAEVAGLTRKKIRSLKRGFFQHRAFLSRSLVSGSYLDIWMCGLRTPMKNKPDYCPKYAQV